MTTYSLGIHKLLDRDEKRIGKRRQSIHIKYDGMGLIPLEEVMKRETA